MKRIGVLTSGGDAAGMNAAIRAVARTGISRGFEVVGIQRGYAGLIHNTMVDLGHRDVGGILQLGGTMLGSSRCPEMLTPEGRKAAVAVLSQHSIDALIVIGGNGSQTGAYELSRLGVPVIGIGSTIDNDLVGADLTLGVDTALNIALEAIDRLKVTASSHQRAFLVEVMGRECGYLALVAGITGGAEAVVLPGGGAGPGDVEAAVLSAFSRGKRHAIIVVAEGANWNAQRLSDDFRTRHHELGFELRSTILGHVQRGGSPGSFDRLLGSRLGEAAITRLEAGETDVLLGIIGNKLATTPLSEVVGRVKPLDPDLLRLAEVLAH